MEYRDEMATAGTVQYSVQSSTPFVHEVAMVTESVT